MSIEIPNLDDLTYQQLIDTLIRSIPHYSGQWSDFNASDPGITLLEMLSWISESLLYRANNISDLSYKNYLQLIVGEQVYEPEDRFHADLLTQLKYWPTPQTADGIARITSKVQAYWCSTNRVISEVDYYALSLEAYYNEQARQMKKTPDTRFNYRQQSLINLQQLRRVFVLADDSVEQEDNVKSIEVIINTALDPREQIIDACHTQSPFELDIKQMLMAVKNFIIPRRPVGTMILVRQVDNTDIDLQLDVKFSSSSANNIVQAAIKQQVNAYVSAFIGGRDDSGWPLGEPLLNSDLVRLIGEVNGIAGITNIQLSDYAVISQRKHEIPTAEMPKDALQIYNHQLFSENEDDSQPWSILVKPENFLLVKAQLLAIEDAQPKSKAEAVAKIKTPSIALLTVMDELWKKEKIKAKKEREVKGESQAMATEVTDKDIIVKGENVAFDLIKINELVGKVSVTCPAELLSGIKYEN
ncbi:MAG: hypothetical protein RPS47_11535 [Colwellia sp.]|jgi:hypothetical protein